MQFHIKNMTCGGCARNVTKAIQGVDPLAELIIDSRARNVNVTSQRPRADIEAALERAG